MGIFSKLFSSSETVQKTVDAVINTGDALWFTDEEKSVASQKKLDWLLKYHEASKGSNIARRVISMMMIGTFITLVLACGLMTIFDHNQAGDLLKLLEKTMSVPVGLIIIFYYGIPAFKRG